MLCCGPLPLPERIARPHQAVSAFAADGALLGDESMDDARSDTAATAG
jgi:hypothetical protein